MQVIEKVKVVPEGYNGAEIAPLTQEQQNMLLSNQDYVNNYNALQSMVRFLFYLSKF